MKDYDLTEGRINTVDKLEATLKPLSAGDEIVLPQVTFMSQSAELGENSLLALEKAVRLMKGNPSVKFSIGVEMYGYQRDSAASSPDLTETYLDSVQYTITTTMTDSTGTQTTNVRDSLAARTMYHNDRSADQAIEISNHLVEQGVPAAGLWPWSRVFVAVPEERKTVVKIRAR
jgi:hypothetical protein